MKKIGKLFCACCGYDWGIVSKLDQLLIPIIKIDAFVIHKVSADGSKYRRAKTYKKWKDVLFSIEDVEFV
ncbi:hypothetical protein, partial [Salmonella sp. s55004]|uniref:hypothetical protein n=1 Tax=Salmonella sp. s55004 TaxID=3159675 RepID=UPI0039810A93